MIKLLEITKKDGEPIYMFYDKDSNTRSMVVTKITELKKIEPQNMYEDDTDYYKRASSDKDTTIVELCRIKSAIEQIAEENPELLV